MSLEVTALSKEYPTPSEPLRVLTDVSFQLDAGASLAVVGPSGCGKSTLLYILGTLDQPTGGTVRIGGVDPFALGKDQIAQFRNQTIGFVFQDHHLLPQLSVVDNVALPAVARGPVDSATHERVLSLIERVGLKDRRSHLPGELSGGERQRVAVARSLLLRPQLLLADEPTGNLDRTNAMAITDLLLEMQSEDVSDEAKGPTLIVVTHSQEVASRMSQQLALEGGRLVSESARS